MKLLLLLAILSGLRCVGQTASSCKYLAPEVKPNDSFQFTMAFLESLSYAKSAFRPSTDLPANADPTLQLSDLIFRIKAADLDYSCAAELLSGYQKSKDTMIALTAFSAVLTYQSLSGMEKESVVLVKEWASGGSDKVSSSDLAEKMANLRLRKSDTWSALPAAVPGITSVLVSRVPGKLSSLLITTQQRKAITLKLEHDFGPGVESGVREEEDSTRLTAKMFYAWISDKGWKNSDSK
jgi:hypothetical protein